MKAVFLDRDGVINELIYHQEQGIIDSPLTIEQFSLLPGVSEAIRKLRETDYKVILVSNQPGIAKGHISQKTFDKIREKMKEELAKDGALLDGEYYCFHHPEAKVEEFRANCECRKPGPGLLGGKRHGYRPIPVLDGRRWAQRHQGRKGSRMPNYTFGQNEVRTLPPDG